MDSLASKMIGKHKTSMKVSRTMPMLRSYTREDIQEQYLSSKQARVQAQEQQRPNDPQTTHSNDPNSENSVEKKRQLGTISQVGSKTVDQRKLDDKVADNSVSSKRARSTEARTSERRRRRQRERENSNFRVEAASGDGVDQESDFDNDNYGNEDEASDENSHDQAGGCQRRARRRKRRRRAQSASLFSACFNIPNLSNILAATSGQTQSSSQQQHQHQQPRSITNETSHSQKRSILAHLRLQQPSTVAGREQLEMARRPISASQTAGNLKQAAGGLNDSDQTPTNTAGTLRKHVSFQGGQIHSSSHFPSADCKNQQIDRSKPSTNAGDESRKASGNDRGEAGSTIIRNYQPSIALTARLGGTTQTAPPAATNVQSPIYRTNQPTTQLNQPIQQQPRSNQQQPCTSGMIGTFPSRSNSAQQQDHSLHSVQLGVLNLTTPPQSHPQQQRQQQHQQPSSGSVIPSNSSMTPIQVYRRPPAVPTRTQATQTEITAYHLMTTPPVSSGTSSIAGVGGGGGTGVSCRDASGADGSGRGSIATTTLVGLATGTAGLGDTPSSATTTGGLSSNQTPIRSSGVSSSQTRIKSRLNERKNTLDDEENEWSMGRVSTSSAVEQSRNLTQKQQRQQAHEPSTSAGSLDTRRTENPGDYDDEDGDDDDDIDAVANLNASLLLASSSCSSSSASLVGHDSALANSLHCEHVRVSSSTMGEMPEAASVKPSRKHEQVRRDDKYMIDTQARQHELRAPSKQTAGGDGKSERNIKSVARCSVKTGPFDIEPPGEFKDYGIAPMNFNPEQTNSVIRPSQQQQHQQYQQWIQSCSPANNALASFGGSESIDKDIANVADGANCAINDDEQPSLSEASSQTDASFAPTRTLAEVGRLLSGNGNESGPKCWSSTPMAATPIASQATSAAPKEQYPLSSQHGKSGARLKQTRRASQPPSDIELRQQQKQHHYKQRSSSQLHTTAESQKSTTGNTDVQQKLAEAFEPAASDVEFTNASSGECHESDNLTRESCTNHHQQTRSAQDGSVEVAYSEASYGLDDPSLINEDNAANQRTMTADTIDQRNSSTEICGKTTTIDVATKDGADAVRVRGSYGQQTNSRSPAACVQQSIASSKLTGAERRGSPSLVIEDRALPSRQDNASCLARRSIEAERHSDDSLQRTIGEKELLDSNETRRRHEQHQQPMAFSAVGTERQESRDEEEEEDEETKISASQLSTSESAVEGSSETKGDMGSGSTSAIATAVVTDRNTRRQTEPIETPYETSIVLNIESQLAQSFDVQKPPNVIRSSTSTLSTRHHSYCSTSEVNPFGALVRAVHEDIGDEDDDEDVGLAVDNANASINAAVSGVGVGSSTFISDTLDMVDDGYGCGTIQLALGPTTSDVRADEDECSEAGCESKVAQNFSSVDDESLNASSNSVATRISYVAPNESVADGLGTAPGIYQTASTRDNRDYREDDGDRKELYVQPCSKSSPTKTISTDTIDAATETALAATATTAVVSAVATAAAAAATATTGGTSDVQTSSASPACVFGIPASDNDPRCGRVVVSRIDASLAGSKTNKRAGNQQAQFSSELSALADDDQADSDATDVATEAAVRQDRFVDKVSAPQPPTPPANSTGELKPTVSGDVSGGDMVATGMACPSLNELEGTTKTIKRNRARATFMVDTEAAAEAAVSTSETGPAQQDSGPATAAVRGMAKGSSNRNEKEEEDDGDDDDDECNRSASSGHKIPADRGREPIATPAPSAETTSRQRASKPELERPRVAATAAAAAAAAAEDIAPKEAPAQKAKVAGASYRSYSSSSSAASSNMMRSVEDDRKSSISSAGSSAQGAAAQQQQQPAATALATATTAMEPPSAQRKPVASSSFCMSAPTTSALSSSSSSSSSSSASSSSSSSSSSSISCKERPALESSVSSTSTASRERRIGRISSSTVGYDEFAGRKQNDELGADYTGFSGTVDGNSLGTSGSGNETDNVVAIATAAAAASADIEAASNKDLAGEPPSSPPTTVSELDADEDLSTPSFVDSYRRRFEQARHLADTVLEGALNQWLETEQRKGSADARDRPRQLRSGASASAGSSSSDAGDPSMHKMASLVSESGGAGVILNSTSNDAQGQQTILDEYAREDELIDGTAAYLQGRCVTEKPLTAKIGSTQEVKFAGSVLNQSGAEARNQESCHGSDLPSNRGTIGGGVGGPTDDPSSSRSSSGGSRSSGSASGSCSSAATVSSRPREADVHVPDARTPTVKPVLPAKPAHLQREQFTSYYAGANQLADATDKQNSQAAAAVAVTATSLAGAAAALHSSGTSGQRAKGLESSAAVVLIDKGDAHVARAISGAAAAADSRCADAGDGRDDNWRARDAHDSAAAAADTKRRLAPADSANLGQVRRDADELNYPRQQCRATATATAPPEASAAEDNAAAAAAAALAEAAPHNAAEVARQSSPELSTVSEASDERSGAASASASASASGPSLSLSRSTSSRQRQPSAALASLAARAAPSSPPPQQQPQPQPTHATLADAQATDADLCNQSEYTLADDTPTQSCSVTAGAASRSQLSALASPDVASASSAFDQTGIQRRQTEPTPGERTRTPPTTSAAAPAQVQQLRPSHRQSPSAIGGVDCPYVHDIQPLSPPPPAPPLQPPPAQAPLLGPQPQPAQPTSGAVAAPAEQSAQVSAVSSQGALSRRLSHDDTMEAIEDDVEGEEQELAAMAALAYAAHSAPAHAFALRADSIREEDEDDGAGDDDGGDDGGDDDDEESSVSVSQRGVIVQPCGRQRGAEAQASANRASATATTMTTTTTTTSHSSPGSCSSAPLADEHQPPDEDDEGCKTPVQSAPAPPPPPKAILEHLSRHHPMPISLDEPSLGPEQARSLSMDVQSRRELWRLDSNKTRDRTQDSDGGSIGGGGVGALDVDVDVGGDVDGDGDAAANAAANANADDVDVNVGADASADALRPGDGFDSEEPAHKDRDAQVDASKGNRTRTLSDQVEADEQTHALHRSLAGSITSTGTIKRARRAASSEKTSSHGEGDAGEQPGEQPSLERTDSIEEQRQPPTTGGGRRGPPLGQLRATQASRSTSSQHTDSIGTSAGANAASQPAPGASQTLADTSICSSCSCMETTTESVSARAIQAAPLDPNASAAGQHTQQSSEPKQQRAGASTNTRAQQQQQQQQWMSQEEGTVFTENYWLPHWLYISEHEESEIWRRAIDMGNTSSGDPSNGGSQTTTLQEVPPGMPADMCELESTASERSFSTRYKSTTRKMIHRRATIEMYKRIMNNNLKCEKRVEISRSNGEFGFRIHGSRPVVVSAIERGTSAEVCGLQVGDLIYAINGTNILDMAHSDVVRLAHNANSPALVLDLVPTNDFLRMSKYNRAANNRYEPSVTGYLMRLSPSTAQPMLFELQEKLSRSPGVSSQQRGAELNQVMRLVWRRRYFVLRSDNCLYWYKSPTDVEPFGGINLQGFSATLTNEFREPNYVIRLVKYGGQPHYLGTNNLCDIQTWIDAINKAATDANQNDPYMKRTLMLVRGKPQQIPEPDHNGYLHKYSQKRTGGAHWKPAYFVLKDACLYMFRDKIENVTQASAVYYLHGYRVRSKTIENKKHTFELVPPNRETIKPMFLMAASEIEKKSWIAALEYSIDRWIEID